MISVIKVWPISFYLHLQHYCNVLFICLYRGLINLHYLLLIASSLISFINQTRLDCIIATTRTDAFISNRRSQLTQLPFTPNPIPVTFTNRTTPLWDHFMPSPTGGPLSEVLLYTHVIRILYHGIAKAKLGTPTPSENIH